MKTIGRTDKVDFPEFSLKNINVKIDTGAYTSSIHSHHIKEVMIDGEKHIEFQLLDPTHAKYRDEILKTKRYRQKLVKNSFGKSEQRFVIRTVVVLFEQEYPIELSLSERSDMKYPILLGRKLLKHQFIVDTSKKNLSFTLKQEKKRLKNK